MEEKRKVRARFIIEVMGKPKEMLTKALKDIVKGVGEDGYGVESESYSKPKKAGKILFSAFVEFEIICDDLESLLGAILDYVPINVEVLEPENFSINISSLQEIVNDITSRLDNLDKQIKMLQAANAVLYKKLQGFVNVT